MVPDKSLETGLGDCRFTQSPLAPGSQCSRHRPFNTAFRILVLTRHRHFGRLACFIASFSSGTELQQTTAGDTLIVEPL